uniref:Putative secreted salivary protein n=1 Tax=Ixodes scapularis TaxID=6945 RepID=Q4PN36_IXOSC|nr:putative secreted salivary protein [Ixodes scapularis]
MNKFTVALVSTLLLGTLRITVSAGFLLWMARHQELTWAVFRKESSEHTTLCFCSFIHADLYVYIRRASSSAL